MKPFRFRSIKGKIIVMVILSACTSILLFSVFTFRNIARRFDSTIEESYQMGLNGVGEKFGQALEEMHRVASGLTYKGGIIVQVEDYLMTSEVLRRRELANRIMEQLCLYDFQSQVVGNICFCFPGEGKGVILSNASFMLPAPDRPIFFRRQPYTEFLIPADASGKGDFVLSLARWAGNVDGRDFYVYMESDSDFLKDLFSQLQDSNGEQLPVCLVDAAGKVLYAAGESPAVVGEGFPEEEMQKSFVPFLYSGEEWGLYLCVPRGDYQRLYASVFLEVVMIILVYAFFSALMAFAIYRAAYRPLDAFTKELSKGERAGLHGHGASQSREFGEYWDKIEEMRIEICRLVSRVEQEGRQKTYLENQLLLSRINPHFIHNTLNSIGLQAAGQGEEDLAETLRALNNLLYHNLGKNRVTLLRDELRAAEDYVYLQHRIQKFVFEKEIDLPERLMDMQMPGFVLQPVIENCFQHGGTLDLKISLEAFLSRNQLWLVVEDNGQGISKEKEEQLNRQFLAVSAGGGIGLGYVSLALKMFFGDSVTLTAGTGREGCGTRIAICIQTGQAQEKKEGGHAEGFDRGR